MIKKIFKGLWSFTLFLLWCVPCTILLLEIGVRIWGYSEHSIYDPIYMPYEQSADIPYVHKPGLSNARARGLAILNTDRLGLRTDIASTAEYPPKAANEKRIAVTGDSLTFGEGIKDNKDTYCSTLEQLLNKNDGAYQYRVFNFGVSAYSVREMANTLKYRMPEVLPDFVIMSVYPADFALSRTGKVDKYGYTNSAQSKEVSGIDGVFKKLLRNMHLTYLVRDFYVQLQYKNQKLNMNEEKKLPDSYKYLLEFRDFAQKNNLDYLIVLLPKLQDSLDKSIIGQLQQDTVHYLDLQFIKDEFSREQYQTSQFDAHPSEVVHKRIGEELAQYLARYYADK